MKTNDDIRRHYSVDLNDDELVRKVSGIVDGLPTEAVEAASEAGFDQFHVRGIAATADLARLAGIGASSYVLDAGSGFGGPSRYLAKTFGCRVLGVDLTPAFVAIARMFAERMGFQELVTYEVGDLAALPFANGTFDVVWTQHVVMNVPDRKRVYREFHRVLKAGGTLAFYDVVATDDDARPYYPVPWAESEATSFLLSKSQTLEELEGAGFAMEVWDDLTDAALTWFASTATTAPPVPQQLSLAALMGPRFGPMTANFARSLREGKLRIAMGIAKVAVA